jgi:hypothetical protein
LGGAFSFAPIHGVGGVPPKNRQQARCALDLVLVQDPNSPAVIFLMIKLIFDSLHVKVIGKGARGWFICQMPDHSHINQSYGQNRFRKQQMARPSN